MSPAATARALSSQQLRAQIESALAHRIPSALTLAPRPVRPVVSTGIASIDQLLSGGIPIGAITEIVGSPGSGHSSLSLSFLAQITAEGKVCAWIDVSNSLQPESAAATGVNLPSLLWVRCGAPTSSPAAASSNLTKSFTLPDKYLVPPPFIHGLHGGGCGGHPRGETKGMPSALTSLLRTPASPSPAPLTRPTPASVTTAGASRPLSGQEPQKSRPPISRPGSPTRSRILSNLEQALRVTDLLLQAGGFSAIVLDLAGIDPAASSRVPLATWFRYRAAAERTQSSVLLLTQHPCAKSSAALVLELEANQTSHHPTLFTTLEHRIQLGRQRFPDSGPEHDPQQTPKVVPLRKPPRGITSTSWLSQPAWMTSSAPSSPSSSTPPTPTPSIAPSPSGIHVSSLAKRVR